MKKAFIFLVAVMLISALIIGGCAEKTSTTTVTTTVTNTATATSSTAVPATSSTAAPASTSTPAPGTPKYGGTLKIGESFGFPSTSVGWMAEFIMYIGNLAEPMWGDALLKCDGQGILSPGLATSYKVADDLSSITLTLRKGVKFHDGSDFNATVAKWNLDVAMDAHISDFAGVASVDIVDDYTIRLNMSNYTNSILNSLANSYQMSKEAYDSHGGGKAGQDYLRWHPVGTGPFKFVSFEPDTVLKMTRFDGYWQEGKPYLDAIEYYNIPDPMTRAAAFEAGEVDFTTQDLSKIEYDLGQKGYPILKRGSAVANILPDGRNEDSPFHDVRVRQALDYAVDRDAIVKNLGYGFWQTTYVYSVPGSPTYPTDLVPHAYDPDKAKQLLADAGYANGFKTQLLVNTTMPTDVGTAVRGYLSKVGIDASIVSEDMGQHMDEFMHGWHGLKLCGTQLTANPNSVLSTQCMLDGPFAVSIARSQELQDLYLASATSKEFNAAATQKLLKFVHDEGVFLTIYVTSNGKVMRPFVKDTGCFTGQNPGYWEPASTWLDK
jgi:peptide/nickel transport system substrate-binding protein